MMRSLLHSLRIFIAEAWLAYHGQFSITSPFGYLATKFGFPFFQMLFFVFLGKFVGFSNPLYIILGNVLIIPATGSMMGITLSVLGERGWGTLSIVMGSPAPRSTLFFGRSLFYILDGFITAIIGFTITSLIFQLDYSQINIGMLVICSLLVVISSSGIGFVFGSISLISRDVWVILNAFLQALYILVGVNIPVNSLPMVLQKISYSLPLTRGIMAARLALNGGNWSSISSLAVGEAMIGGIYILIGYLFYRIIEKRSLVSGTLDAM